jgi:4-aminobutyrate aminotransferase/(S)-3-amino-2-methylpropionate transaminase
MAILSFSNSFHGRSIGALSCTNSEPIHKLDMPQLNWPTAPYPKIKYPHEAFAAENKAEEDRCLEQTRKILTETKI